MCDLISRNALQDAIPKNDVLLSVDVRRIICEAPKVDAEPVRHGRWIQSKTVPSYHYCSQCRVPQKMEKSCNIYVYIHYCPYCGAKMDAGKEGEGE